MIKLQRQHGSFSPQRPVKLFEIGVQSGGSARAWKNYFRDRLYYVGMDIDERCKRSHSPSEKIFIEIGSQLEKADLLKVCRKQVL